MGDGLDVGNLMGLVIVGGVAKSFLGGGSGNNTSTTRTIRTTGSGKKKKTVTTTRTSRPRGTSFFGGTSPF